MPEQTSADLSELSRKVCAALEPDAKPWDSPPSRLWTFVIGSKRREFTKRPRPLLSGTWIGVAEALLRQDPARKERYAEELVREIGGNKSFSSGIVDLALFEVFDIATATPEQRLRAAHRALRGE